MIIKVTKMTLRITEDVRSITDSNAFCLLKLLIPAEDDIKNKRYKKAGAFFKEFKLKISERPIAE